MSKFIMVDRVCFHEVDSRFTDPPIRKIAIPVEDISSFEDWRGIFNEL